MNAHTTAQGARAKDNSTAGQAAPCAWWLRQPDDDDVNTIQAWLGQPAISQWFDFGLGRQQLSTLALRLMLCSQRHHIRLFGRAGDGLASGLVAVSDVNHAFATGSFWVVRDPLRPAYAGMTCDASRRILQDVFTRYQLRCITAWAVQVNVRSHRLLERVGFRRIGLQRACHPIGGEPCGRILYDLTPEDLAGNVAGPCVRRS
ncbi:MAG TPA: GNAT family protein [Paraburkholderia sp.]|nr:GNAT family protein [Paraburkholderia sp.]